MQGYQSLKQAGKELKMWNQIGETYRMYHFALYNISPIQAGIQSLHATIDYSIKYGGSIKYKKWAKHDKTVIILSGGGSIDMQEREKELEDHGIEYASFLEPDLNNSISAIAFLVPESIYNFDETEYRDLNGFSCVDSSQFKFYRYLKSFKLAAN